MLTPAALSSQFKTVHNVNMNEIETGTHARDAQPSSASIYISSVAAMSALFFLGVGLPCWWAFDLRWGVGLGAMCAFWGGPGFGVMAAAARLELRHEREAANDHNSAAEPRIVLRTFGRDGFVARTPASL